MNPQTFLARAAERFAPIYVELDRELRRLRDAGTKWTAWCQLPDQLICERLAALGLDRRTNPVDFESVVTAYAWRRSRDVFRFQPPLLRAMTDSRVNGLVGVDALAKLPESCVFIEASHLAGAEGFFARLDYEHTSAHDNLWLQFLALGHDSVMPLALRFGLGQSVEQALAHATVHADDATYAGNAAGEVLKDNVHALVSLVLGLCYARDDLRQQSGVGEGRVWLAGKQIAAELRDADSFSGAAWEMLFLTDLSGGGFEWKHPSLGQLQLKPF